MSKENGKQASLDILVDFGGVSIGKETASLGLSIDRDVMSLDSADNFFCGKRLDGELTLGGGSDPAQSKMWDHEITFAGSFDVKRIGANVSKISTRLTFSLASIDVAELAKFSKGAGRLRVFGVEELADAADDDEDELMGGGTPSTLRSAGPWREVQLDTLFGGAILKSLKQGGLETVGALCDYTASEKRLTDIKGIGPGKAGNIEERLMEFWSSNPQYCDGAEGEAEPEAESGDDLPDELKWRLKPLDHVAGPDVHDLIVDRIPTLGALADAIEAVDVEATKGLSDAQYMELCAKLEDFFAANPRYVRKLEAVEA